MDAYRFRRPITGESTVESTVNRAVQNRRSRQGPAAPPDNATPTFRVPRRVLFAVAAFFVVFAAYDVHSQLPTDVLKLPGEARVFPAIGMIAPQGWAFFTKSPRSAVLVPYQRTAGGGWRSVAAGRISTLRSHVGFDRDVRVQGEEMALLTAHASTKAWRPCGGTVTACLAKATTATVLDRRNTSPSPTLCGQIAILSTTPVPWAYRNLSRQSRRSTQVLRLDVSC